MYIEAIITTIYVTVISSSLAYLFGIPLGVILYGTDSNSLFSNKIINKSIGLIVNVLRSIPFIILLVMIQPLSKLVVGTKLGNEAFIFYLTVAATPFVARMVESSLKEVPHGIIEAAKSMGATKFQIIKILLSESVPSLLVGSAIAITTILGYTPMTYLIAGGGLGQLAIQYGLYRSDEYIMYTSSILLVIIVQVIQEALTFIAKRFDKRCK